MKNTGCSYFDKEPGEGSWITFKKIRKGEALLGQ